MNPHDPSQPVPPARRRSGRLPALITLAVVLGLGFGASKLFGDHSSKSSPSPSSASSAPPATHKAGDWNVGDCGGPDPDRRPDGYRPYGCGDPQAAFKAIEVKAGSFLPDSIQCPGGTDLIIQVSISFGSSKDGKDGKGGIPSKTVCGRNLSGDHPGDPGAGGGQLVKGDCVTSTAKEVPCASATGDGYKVLDLVKNRSACPEDTTEPMELTIAIGRPYDVICAAKA
ncbi:hypothetical protein AB0K09_30955 [Streptomyces sp. NPDC049577]|uniref:hypothetical protein n=1 Tax=Streptomyces sp. NPDC049577 TaxID=3155153 RepID=UPI00342C6D08